ncbi:RNA helicase Mov10l1-like isoform X2 [Ruditapes philippinarum]|uniref:RNA helicase Mov10l1-like isoform X2 n=1 Tax=Ruditapes philippinarum TaxID=129788 RepID=UPI00295C1669|nr:RNA helicase Mov10l1-like isoform X2 [Ruditapes philippinarum]
MFSGIRKLWDYISEQEDQTDTSNESQLVVGNGAEACSRREYEGKITHIFSSHGLIDNEVYFSFDDVLGGVKPNLNDVVTVVAAQHHSEGGWHAEQVSVVENWEDQDYEVAEVTQAPSEIVGHVGDFNGKTGYIGNVYFDLSECKCEDFKPAKGDLVKVCVVYPDGDTFSPVASEIQALRVKEADGVISGEKGDHGYIDGEVFYLSDVIVNDYIPRKWDPVHYKAVESLQGRSSWRAVFIEPSEKPQKANWNLLQGPLQQSFTKELLSDKEGVCVSKETDFGTMAVGRKLTLSVIVENKGTTEQTMCRCHMTASSSQIKIQNISVFKANRELVKTFGSGSNIGDLTLCPNMSVIVKLDIDARYQGQEKQLLIFTFEKFKIGRYITANITDPVMSLIDHNQPYTQGGRQGYNRYRENVDRSATPWMIPGERPNRNKKTVQFPHRLPHYNVPEDLRQIILTEEELLYYAPVLAEELTYKNYRDKFKMLLHLEEIQMDIDIREFDLHRVCLRHFSEYLALPVPGLAEGRPSVLIGDKVILIDPSDPDGPCFEGYVHEILKDEVLLKFNPDFHRTYTGKDYNVQFTFNRGPLRKCHRASESANGLGENILFPTTLVPKPARCILKQNVKPTGKFNTGQEVTSRSPFFNKHLNARQRSAVTRIVQGQGRPLPYILFGPPGTGKTVTVVEAILQIFTKLSYSRIIACTPSNSAADLLTQRLHESGLVKTGDLVRLNAQQRSEQDLPDSIRPYCSVGDDLDLASRYRILVSTCVTAGTLYTLGIKSGHFTHVFIDEAGQATEPEALISSCLVSHTDGQITLAGDPQQLGPVLMSKFSKMYGLELSLLERLIHTPLYERDEQKFADHGAYDPLLVTKLLDNYRSHTSINPLLHEHFVKNGYFH